MEDMAPELLQTIRLAWQKALISDAELRSLTKRITEGKATYKEVEDVAYRVGKDLSKALVGNITSDIMPDGHVPQNVAEKILQPTLREAHAMVIEAATKTQEAMNKAAGIGLKAQAAEFDAEKAQGLVYKLTNGLLEDTGWILDAPVTEFVQSSADRTMKKNVDFQARAGLHPIITRKAEGKCCEWCSNLEGSYEYGDEPKDIYRRHRRCRCVVDYRPGNGKRQNVWSKAWHEDAEPEKVEERKKRIERQRREKKVKEYGKTTGLISQGKNGKIILPKLRKEIVAAHTEEDIVRLLKEAGCINVEGIDKLSMDAARYLVAGMERAKALFGENNITKLQIVPIKNYGEYHPIPPTISISFFKANKDPVEAFFTAIHESAHNYDHSRSSGLTKDSAYDYSLKAVKKALANLGMGINNKDAKKMLYALDECWEKSDCSEVFARAIELGEARLGNKLVNEIWRMIVKGDLL